MLSFFQAVAYNTVRRESQILGSFCTLPRALALHMPAVGHSAIKKRDFYQWMDSTGSGLTTDHILWKEGRRERGRVCWKSFTI